jgi:hypothetical protein
VESWGIFKHAIWMVFANFKDALRVTGGLYLATVVAGQIFLGNLLVDNAAMQAAIMNGTMPWGAYAAYMIVLSIVTTWAAIGWHRYVLLEEKPAFVPKLLPRIIVSYFGNVILVTLLVCLAAIIPGAFIGAIGGFLATLLGFDAILAGSLLGALGGVAALFYLTYRFAALFPAIAIGQPMKFGEAWAKLRHKNSMILGLMLLTVLTMGIVTLPTFIISQSSILGLVIYHLTGWFNMIVAASILTTLYGVYVEGRALPQA